jgi:5-methylcytosine-specific restriction endonuclease McrA
MSGYIPAALVRNVRERASNACEYCWLPQHCQEATYHVDHVLPRSKGGLTSLDNLALACVTCSLRKAARAFARDPHSGETVRLFNPREDDWNEHFRFTPNWRIEGRTAIARATLAALGMNRPAIITIRRRLASLGRF